MQGQYDASKDHIVTAASCTTNCLAPVVKVIHENLKIVKGAITTVHCVTNTQTIIDAPNAKKADLRRARSGLMNLAPTSTGSATAIALIFPDLKGKLNGASHCLHSMVRRAHFGAWLASQSQFVLCTLVHGHMQGMRSPLMTQAAVCLQGMQSGCRSPTPASRIACLKWNRAQLQRRSMSCCAAQLARL